MSHFINEVVYIIIPSVDASQYKLNLCRSDFHVTSPGRESQDGTKNLLKLKLSTVLSTSEFNDYVWFNTDEIKIEMLKTEWIDTL